jgi:hypothetical protein
MWGPALLEFTPLLEELTTEGAHFDVRTMRNIPKGIACRNLGVIRRDVQWHDELSEFLDMVAAYASVGTMGPPSRIEYVQVDCRTIVVSARQ